LIIIFNLDYSKTEANPLHPAILVRPQGKECR
jgi:hypothetical protein